MEWETSMEWEICVIHRQPVNAALSYLRIVDRSFAGKTQRYIHTINSECKACCIVLCLWDDAHSSCGPFRSVIGSSTAPSSSSPTTQFGVLPTSSPSRTRGSFMPTGSSPPMFAHGAWHSTHPFVSCITLTVPPNPNPTLFFLRSRYGTLALSMLAPPRPSHFKPPRLPMPSRRPGADRQYAHPTAS